MNRLGQLRALNDRDRLLLVQAGLLLGVAGALLRSIGFKRTQRALARSLRTRTISGRSSSSIVDAERIGWIVGVAARHGLYRANCLPQSLVLWWLLRRAGKRAQLRIGVKRSAAGVAAHAWVDVDGRAVGEPPSTRDDYAAFRPFDPSPGV